MSRLAVETIKVLDVLAAYRRVKKENWKFTRSQVITLVNCDGVSKLRRDPDSKSVLV